MDMVDARNLDWLEKKKLRSDKFWVKDTIVVICNKVNKAKRAKGKIDFVDEEKIYRMILNYEKKNNIPTLLEAAKLFNKEISDKISRGASF